MDQKQQEQTSGQRSNSQGTAQPSPLLLAAMRRQQTQALHAARATQAAREAQMAAFYQGRSPRPANPNLGGNLAYQGQTHTAQEAHPTPVGYITNPAAANSINYGGPARTARLGAIEMQALRPGTLVQNLTVTPCPYVREQILDNVMNLVRLADANTDHPFKIVTVFEKDKGPPNQWRAGVVSSGEWVVQGPLCHGVTAAIDKLHWETSKKLAECLRRWVKNEDEDDGGQDPKAARWAL